MNGNWYYLNNEGKIVKGEQVINGNNFTLIKMASKLKGTLLKMERTMMKNSGVQVTNRYVNFNNNWYRIGAKGTPLKGAHVVDGHNVSLTKTVNRLRATSLRMATITVKIQETE